MTHPLVSVLLPVWNAAATLPACLRSVQRQTAPRWQCVLVDDGSDDDSLACARWFASQDTRFEVIATPHQGLVPALHSGLAHCRGRFVARMDADDLMHRQRLAMQLRVLAEYPHMDAVGCHVRLFPRQGLPEGRRAYERWLNSINTPCQVRQEAFVECPIAHPTLMMRSQVLRALGYRDCGWPEDYDLLLRLLTQGYTVGVVPRRLLSWRDSPQRLSRCSPIYALECFTACKAAFLASGFLRDTKAYVLWGYGDTGKALRRALVTHGKSPSYIVELHPGRLGNRIHNAPVIRPEALAHVRRDRIVVSVAGMQARREIRHMLTRLGCVELRDFICAA